MRVEELQCGRYLEYGLLDVLAQPLRHPAHVIRHLVHALRQAVWQGLHGIGHVSHGASERIYKRVYLKAQEQFQQTELESMGPFSLQ